MIFFVGRNPVEPFEQLDLDALGAAGIVTPNAPRSLVADKFRVLKRPLLTSAKATGISATGSSVS